jgi:uncharacterized protein (TIGR02145 family)
MERLPVTSATATAGTVTKIQGNDKGVWVIGNARSAGSFSAKVHLLTATADLHGVCAYASNYPPVGKYTSANEISFTGTPMYNIVLKHASGSTVTRRSDSLFSVPESYAVQSFTDATGAPGSISPLKANTPIYAASTQTWTLAGSAGTQTWSAYINMPGCDKSDFNGTLLDCRSGPDTVFFYSVSYAIQNETSLCPDGWRLPSLDDLCTLDRIINDIAQCRTVYSETGALYLSRWGGKRTGMTHDNAIIDRGDDIAIWNSHVCQTDCKSTMVIHNGRYMANECCWSTRGYPVRCLK